MVTALPAELFQQIIIFFSLLLFFFLQALSFAVRLLEKEEVEVLLPSS